MPTIWATKGKINKGEFYMTTAQQVTLYDAIQIDQNEISQSLLNIDDKKRSNLFAWNGQFSPQFIETMLAQYAKANFTVADPFLGSGTVLYECAQKNISALGSELNPSAYYMAKIYELCNLDKNQRVDLIQAIGEKIVVCSQQQSPLDSLLVLAKGESSTLVANTISLLVVLLDLFNNHFSNNLLFEKWHKLSSTIKSLPYSKSNICATLGDARSLTMDNSIVDLIITSPPYINVFNYHQKYRRSVESLGYDVLKIAKKEIGSNRKNRGKRYLTVIEYCIDMAYALKEMIRITKPNARIILVVGKESNVLATAFSNSELIYRLAIDVFNLHLTLKQQRGFKNKFGKMIYEDILHFSNSKANYQTLSDEEILSLSRLIAVEFLQQKLSIFDTTSKNYPLLEAAIRNFKTVKTSDIRGVLS